MSTRSVLVAGVPITKLPIYLTCPRWPWITKSAAHPHPPATQRLPKDYLETTWFAPSVSRATPFLGISGVSKAYPERRYHIFSPSILPLCCSDVPWGCRGFCRFGGTPLFCPQKPYRNLIWAL